MPPIHPASDEADILPDWTLAEAGQAAALARAAARLGALDDRLMRGPEGWRHRLALTEAGDLGWFSGDRVAPDRLALWLALRLAGVHEDAGALARLGWAMRRLSGGPGPEAGLQAFLGRHEAEEDDDTFDEPLSDRLSDRIEGWTTMLASAGVLHPLTRGCLGYHLWPLAGLDRRGDGLEAAVTGLRLAAADCRGGAVFAPVAMGGTAALRPGGPPSARLERWLAGAEAGALAAMRHLDRLERWQDSARARTAALSGRTPARLVQALTGWPMLSAPMAEALTGSSRAAVQRNLAWFQAQGLAQEVTGQGRFRFWRAAL